MLRGAALVPVFILLVATACANREYDTQQPAVDLGPDSVFVLAINENYYDARVHAIYGSGQRMTLGTIPGNGGETRVALSWQPRALIFEITFIIDGRTYVSQPRDVARGETFELRLPANIDQSGFFRRVNRS